MSAVELTPVVLPARNISPPSTISEAARQALSISAATLRAPWPDPADLAAWRVAIAESAVMWADVAGDMLAACSASIEDRTIAGVPCYVATPSSPVPGLEECVYLYIHGGAFVFGGGLFAKAFGASNAERLGIKVVSVDYRMPPDHPFPAAPEDCVAVYRALIEKHDPARIVIGGSSAGGNLAAAATLMIRDRGIPAPAAVVLQTPELDLTESGDTFRTNEHLDVVLKRSLAECNALYAAGEDLTHPYLSPLFADMAKGFPPTLVQTGTRDLFLSNSVLFHRKLRKAGIETDLHVWEAMPHGGFGFGDVPENLEISEEIGRFIRRRCG